MRRPARAAHVVWLALVPLLMVGTLAQSPAGGDAEALFEAARTGDRARVVSLLNSGVDVNSRSRYGVTAAGFAADKGHLEVVRLLVERGANLDVTDSFYGSRPIDFAMRGGHPDVVAVSAVARLEGRCRRADGWHPHGQPGAGRSGARDQRAGRRCPGRGQRACRTPGHTGDRRAREEGRVSQTRRITAAGDRGAGLRSARARRALPERDQRRRRHRRRVRGNAHPCRAGRDRPGAPAVRGAAMARRRCPGDDHHLCGPRRHGRATDNRARDLAAPLRA